LRLIESLIIYGLNSVYYILRCWGHSAELHSGIRLHGGRLLVFAARSRHESRAGQRPTSANHRLQRVHLGARHWIVLWGHERRTERSDGTFSRRVRFLHLLHSNHPP